MIRTLFFFSITLYCSATFSADARTTFGKWSVYKEASGICYTRGMPLAKGVIAKEREEAYIQISFFPQMNFFNEVFVIPGYTYKKEEPVYVKIDGGKQYKLSEDGYKSVAPDNIKNAVVTEMRKGKFLKVEGTAESGEKTTDLYLLRDFNQAYIETARLCDILKKSDIASDKNVREIDAGNKTIIIAPPSNLKNISHDKDYLQKYSSEYLYPSVKLLGLFLTNKDDNQRLKGKEPEFEKWAEILIATEAYGINVNQKAFHISKMMLTGSFVNQPNAFINKDNKLPVKVWIKKTKSKDIQVDPTLKINTMGFGGIFINEPTKFSYFEVFKDSDGSTQIKSSSIMLVKGRLIKLYLNRYLYSHHDIDWLKTITMDWLDKIEKLN